MDSGWLAGPLFLRRRLSVRGGEGCGMNREMVDAVLACYQFDGPVLSCEPCGSGHINETYRATCGLQEGKTRRYVLQRMNRSVFADIDG